LAKYQSAFPKGYGDGFCFERDASHVNVAPRWDCFATQRLRQKLERLTRVNHSTSSVAASRPLHTSVRHEQRSAYDQRPAQRDGVSIRQREKVIVPASSIIKTPSMELRPNHPDQGS